MGESNVAVFSYWFSGSVLWQALSGLPCQLERPVKGLLTKEFQ
ncbi:hypothetical protein [Maricurvus nonylphenolicus]